MFRTVLVANRGEIAVRILRTCRRMGLATVAVHSDADLDAPHVRLADRAVRLGPPPVKDSYLNVEALTAAVRETGADAVHPGYGLLSENAGFARAVAHAGATFVGPSPEALDAFGDKITARRVARSVGVEPPPGTEALDPADPGLVESHARAVGFPVLVKAAGGGGGIGMQVVREASELARAVESCSNRGWSAFADARVYLEKYIESPRHVEVQIFRDRHGAGVALGERECSVQRRHQKIIEESPSPAQFFGGKPGAERRERLFSDALRIVAALNYDGAGTVEFVSDQTGSMYFLEVNARLQVEHAVTEMVTGLDLVELQLRVASGEPLPKGAIRPTHAGHAVEARVYAEDPSKGFLPQPGRIQRLFWPEGLPGVRVDAGVEEGGEITTHYDPMIAKVIAHGADRREAIARLDLALAKTELSLAGPKGPRATNLGFLRKILADPRFLGGTYDTSLAETIARAP